MKIGVCVGTDRYETAAKAGVRYIDVNTTNLTNLTDQEFKESAVKIKDFSFEVVGSHCFLPGEYTLGTEEYHFPKLMEYAKKVASRLAEVGCPIAVFGSGGSRNLHPEYGIEKGKQQFMEFIGGVSEILNSYRIRLVLEPLNQKETNFITTVKEGYTLASQIQKENCGVLCDYYHLTAENEPLSILYEAKSRLWHCHIASPGTRKAPLPDDGHDYLPFFQTLHSIGYSGAVSVEGGWNTPENIASSLAYLEVLSKP